MVKLCEGETEVLRKLFKFDKVQKQHGRKQTKDGPDTVCLWMDGFLCLWSKPLWRVTKVLGDLWVRERIRSL